MSLSVDHPYAPFLFRLSHPARYLAAEHGAVHRAWDAVTARFCLAFPDTYELGMSHLGLKVLYDVLTPASDLLCERAFAPWVDLEAELRRTGIPLVSIESARPLRDFDVLGFSLQHELTFTTVLAMLELGGLSLRAEARTEDEPLVIGGGPVAAHPEPMAPFFDLFLVGEAERALPELLRQDAALRHAGAGRAERVAALGRRPEIYAPALHPAHRDARSGRLVVGKAGAPVVTRRWEPDLDPLPDTGGGPVPSMEAIFDRAAIEVARGCNQGCRFCQAGFLYRPMRERSTENVLAALEQRAAQGGYDEVSLTALSTADYSGLGDLLVRAGPLLRAGDLSLSVSSLRAIDVPPEVLDFLRTGRGGSLTFAPEAGSQRMRDRINKRISEPGLIRTAREVAARGWSRIKLYFMIGLPEETDEDVDAILELAEQVRQAARAAAPKRAPRVICGVNNLVPKPHTPMQWCAMVSAEEIAHKQARLRHHPLSRRMDLRLHDIPMSLLEARLARGDRALAEVVERAYRLGARFDGWEDQFRPDLWEAAWAEADIAPTLYDASLDRDGRLPWDHVDIGVLPGFLAAEHQRMLEIRPGPACGLPEERAYRPGVACLRCGLPCQEAPPRRAATTTEAVTTATAPEPSALVVSAPPPLPNPVCLEIAYEKRSPATALSHLDLVRHFPRILRRAGLRPAYSAGFNPRPRMVFAPPLPLGAEGEDERCTIWVHADPETDPRALQKALAEASIAGLSIRSTHWLPPEATPLARRIQGARYRFEPTGALNDSNLDARARELLSRTEWWVERKGKRRKGRRGAPRQRDVRPSLVRLAVSTGAPRVSVHFEVRFSDAATLRPSELLSTLLDDPAPEGRLVREGLVICDPKRSTP